jgi:threonylcarbamoyladenosine tRNA methylthiotransferase MtaB
VDPHEITDELIELVASDPVVCRHMHIPLQSGSDAVLGRMKRNYTSGQFKEIVSTLRDKVPQIAITTDIMVGFPGETEEDFLQTMDLARDVAFSKIHVFQYSKRLGTRAARFPEQIASSQKEDRSRRLIQLGEAMAERFHHSFIGENLEVLVEQMQKKQAIGHTDNYVKVTFPEPPDADLVGDVVSVRILSASVDGVQGHVNG